MTVMGVDPHYAKPYAVTIVADWEIKVQVKCDLTALYLLAKLWTPDLIAVEDQYMNKNYKVAKGLSWSAGKVMGVADLLRIKCEVVNVATWKSKMKAQKGQHIKVSTLLAGEADDDLASSHLIALYASTTWTP